MAGYDRRTHIDVLKTNNIKVEFDLDPDQITHENDVISYIKSGMRDVEDSDVSRFYTNTDFDHGVIAEHPETGVKRYVNCSRQSTEQPDWEQM